MGWRLRIPSLICFDAILINFAIIISYLVRFDGNITKPYWTNLFKLSIIATLIFLVIFYICKLYHRIWAYASTGELMTVLKSVTLGSLAVTFITYMTKFPVPRSIILLFWAFGIIFVGGSRFAWRIFVESRHHGKYPVVKTKTHLNLWSRRCRGPGSPGI